MQRAVDKFVQNIAQLISSGKASCGLDWLAAGRRLARFLEHESGAEEEHVSSRQQRVSGGGQSLGKCFPADAYHLQARRLLTDKDFLRACASVSAGHASETQPGAEMRVHRPIAAS